MPAWSPVEAVAALSFAAWLFLLFGHGRYWLAEPRLGAGPSAPAAWPGVVAVVPARNEADVIPETVASLLAQRYPGPFRIVLVDDESEDGTARAALEMAELHPRGERLRVERPKPRPSGWVGKLWALETGVQCASGLDPSAEFLWLSDADVAHEPGTLERLVAKAEAESLDLVSLMVRLRADTVWERLLVPAFVYFFQKLYPFPRVGDPRSSTAGAAGGCVLLRREALERAGGLTPLRGEIIDDCALGRAVKRVGRIWLGHAEAERSVRAYGGVAGVWQMVARSAFHQLRYSWLRLAGTVLGLLLLYVIPPTTALIGLSGGPPLAGVLGGATWTLMAASFVPTLVLYGRSPLWGFALPVAGVLYLGMTLDSARRWLRNEGGEWKGRAGAGSDAAAGRPASD